MTKGCELLQMPSQYRSDISWVESTWWERDSHQDDCIKNCKGHVREWPKDVDLCKHPRSMEPYKSWVGSSWWERVSHWSELHEKLQGPCQGMTKGSGLVQTPSEYGTLQIMGRVQLVRKGLTLVWIAWKIARAMSGNVQRMWLCANTFGVQNLTYHG
jgi:hypothetical protein